MMGGLKLLLELPDCVHLDLQMAAVPQGWVSQVEAVLTPPGVLLGTFLREHQH